MGSAAVFSPKTSRIETIYSRQPHGVDQLCQLFAEGKTKVFIDYANVRPWSDRLEWHVDPRRLLQFYSSFSNISEVSIYQGVLSGDERSEREARQLASWGYRFRTKPVKIMRHSIDASSITPASTNLIAQFVRKALLRKFDLETVEYLNAKLYELNTRGVRYIEDRKCNFDVEIGTDMMVSSEQNEAEVYCLWSGDSDFADTVQQLLSSGRKVILFATPRRVSAELNELQSEGLFIFDIAKIRNYICWPREINIR